MKLDKYSAHRFDSLDGIDCTHARPHDDPPSSPENNSRGDMEKKYTHKRAKYRLLIPQRSCARDYGSNL